jgi:hypothetical protein
MLITPLAYCTESETIANKDETLAKFMLLNATLTIQVSLYDIEFFGSPFVLMLRVIILKNPRLFAHGRFDTACFKQQMSI